MTPSRGLISNLKSLCHLSYHIYVFFGLRRVHLGGAIILPTLSIKCQMLNCQMLLIKELRRQLCVDTNLVLRNIQFGKEADDCLHRAYMWEGVGKTSLEILAHYLGQGHEGSSLKCCRVRTGVIHGRELSEHCAFTATWGWEEYPSCLKPSGEGDLEEGDLLVSLIRIP